jgi:hypothetical protein
MKIIILDLGAEAPLHRRDGSALPEVADLPFTLFSAAKNPRHVFPTGASNK